MALKTKLKAGLLLFSALTLWGVGPLMAEEVQHLRYSIRALGMGNAFVAAVNDESSLYYNPAGLSSVRRHIFEIVGVRATVNQNVIDMGSADDSTAFLGDVVGNKLYLNGGLILPSITAPGWGVSTFSDFTFDAQVHNPTIPYFDLLGYAQAGIIGGVSKSLADKTLDVGVSFKIVQRAGIGKTLHIVDFLDDNFSDNIQDEFVNEQVVSPDVGVIYHYDRWYNFQLKLGATMKHIGGMDFGSSGTIPSTIDLGIASESEFLGFDLLMAADLIDAAFQTTTKKSLARNINMGAELGMWMRSNGHHAVAVRLGRKGAYSTLGLGLNIPYLPMMIDLAQWSEEVGSVAGSKEDKRTSVQLSFNF